MSDRDEARRSTDLPTPQDFGIGQLFWEIRDAVVVGDAATGRIVLWNPAAEALFGIPAAEAVGASIEVLVPESLRERHRTGLVRFCATGRGPLIDSGKPVELPARRRSGEPLTIELTLSPVAASRVPGRFVLAIVRDVTERKQAEADRLRLAQERAARAAAEAEAARQGEAAALLDTLLAAAPNGFALFDRDLRFVRVNQALADINGIPIAVHLGRTLRESVPALAASQEPLIRRVLDTGEPIRDLEVGGETPAAPGAERHWLVSYYPVNDRSGTRRGVGAVVVEITARKHLERMQQDFLAAVSHDLRNPLTALRGQAQLLRRRAARDAAAVPAWVDDAAARIDGLISRMLAMVGDLMDVALLRAGQALELELRPTDLVALARVAVEEHQKATRHSIDFVPTTREVVGCWDPGRLERVLANLLSNAVKYSPDGGPILVEVAATRVGNGAAWAVLTVRDHGIGIPAADLPHVFERFRRGANAGQIVGTGIGLAGAKQIVEQHGGTIAVVSDEGIGSAFTVRLPLDPDARGAAGAANETDRAG